MRSTAKINSTDNTQRNIERIKVLELAITKAGDNKKRVASLKLELNRRKAELKSLRDLLDSI